MKKTSLRRLLSLCLALFLFLTALPVAAVDADAAERITHHTDTADVTATSSDGFAARKYLTINDDGTVTITMETWAANDGEVEIPSYDIVLLFDQSCAANDKRADIFAAAQDFLTRLSTPYEQGGLAATQGAGHRIAVLGYGRINNSGEYGQNSITTPGGIFTGFSGRDIQSANYNTGYYNADGSFISDSDDLSWSEAADLTSNDLPTLRDNSNCITYAQTFMEVEEAQGIINDGYISKWNSGAARLDVGLTLANRVMNTTVKTDTGNTERYQMVLIFSDSCATQEAGGIATSRIGAVTTAMNALRTNCDAVLSIGTYHRLRGDTADTEANYLAQMQEMTGSQQSSDGGETYACKKDPNYTFDLSEDATLDNAFNLMLNLISSTANIIHTDIVPPQFVISDNSATLGEVYTVPFTGYGGTDGQTPLWGDESKTDQTYYYKTDNDGNTVMEVDVVLNPIPTYQYWESQNTPVPKGFKLVVKITVKPADGFIGGNNVPTNDPRSGVYVNGSYTEDGKIKVNFPDPTINVPVRFDYAVRDQSFYFEGSSQYSDVRNDNWITYLIGGTSYRFDGKNNAYVDIEYQIYSQDNKTEPVATCTITHGQSTASFGSTNRYVTYTACTSYTVKCTVTPVSPASSGGTSADTVLADKTAYVHVINPTVTYRDIQFASSEPVAVSSGHVSTVWKCGCTSSHDYGASADIQLEWQYFVDGTAVTEVDYTAVDKDVNVQLLADGVDRTGKVTFVRQSCQVCGYAGDTHGGTEDKAEFVIHTLLTTLTVTKSGASELDEYQTFLFDIKGKAGTAAADVDLTVAIQGNASITITDLPLGTYTVSEQTDWSWRYEVDGAAVREMTFTTSAGMTAIFDNTRNETKWLDGNTHCTNVFNGAD